MANRGNTQPRTTTLRRIVLRTLVPRAALFAGGVATLLLGQAMAVAPSAHSSGAASGDLAVRMPAWTVADAAAHPGCVPSTAWPAEQVAAYLVVHAFRDGLDRTMSLDAAWAANHNDTEVDDVWVVGVCG
jgi:hypothetical protein